MTDSVTFGKNEINVSKLADLLLEFGEKMLYSGAEIDRIESAICKIGISYGLKDAVAFVIPSLIVITLTPENEEEISKTRILQANKYGTNLYRLQKLNDLGHICREKHISLSEFEKGIKECEKKVPLANYLVGSALAAGGFSIFFGGNLWDSITAGIIALLICFFQAKVQHLFNSNLSFTIIVSFIIGVISGFAAYLLPFLNGDKIAIGVIMLIIPGLAITKSIRDIILDDTISGTLSLVNGLFLTGGIALGFFASFLIF